MNDRDRQILDRQLLALISAQDEVTHYNEAGQIGRCRGAQDTRNRIKREIIAFVDSLSADSRQAQGG